MLPVHIVRNISKLEPLPPFLPPLSFHIFSLFFVLLKQASLELVSILLPQPPRYWDYRHVYLAIFGFLR